MTGALGTGLFVATVACLLLNAVEVAGKAVRARFVMQNAAEVGVAPRWIPYLAVLEGAGVAGLLVGLLGQWAIGLAAAAGLVLFFVGAIAVHVRSRVVYNLAFPGVFLVLAVAAVAYFAGQAG
ncbi:DoxX family protein [Nocardia sp. NPDC051750]|uniref:DoxX family protein n=1 Tax=Nocardia sp. NPDC051750 TaxID=3364325 RepID=UPI0037B98921